MNSTAKMPNSTANGTKLTAKVTNSIAKTCINIKSKNVKVGDICTSQVLSFIFEFGCPTLCGLVERLRDVYRSKFKWFSVMDFPLTVCQVVKYFS